jgi:hypothetical protein
VVDPDPDSELISWLWRIAELAVIDASEAV